MPVPSLEQNLQTNTEAGLFKNQDFQARIVEGTRRVEKLSAESGWNVTQDSLNPGKFEVWPLIYGDKHSTPSRYNDGSIEGDIGIEDPIVVKGVGRFHFHPRNFLGFSGDDITNLERLMHGHDPEGDRTKYGTYHIRNSEVYKIVYPQGVTYGVFVPEVKDFRKKPVVQKLRYIGVSGKPTSNLYQRLQYNPGGLRNQIDTLRDSGFKVSYLELPVANATPLWNVVDEILARK